MDVSAIGRGRNFPDCTSQQILTRVTRYRYEQAHMALLENALPISRAPRNAKGAVVGHTACWSHHLEPRRDQAAAVACAVLVTDPTLYKCAQNAVVFWWSFRNRVKSVSLA